MPMMTRKRRGKQGLICCPLSSDIIAIGRCDEYRKFKPGCHECSAVPLEHEDHPEPLVPGEGKHFCFRCGKPTKRKEIRYCWDCMWFMRRLPKAGPEGHEKHYLALYKARHPTEHHIVWSGEGWALNKELARELLRHHPDLVRSYIYTSSSRRSMAKKLEEIEEEYHAQTGGKRRRRVALPRTDAHPRKVRRKQ